MQTTLANASDSWWPAMLPFDVALGLQPIDEILATYDMEEEEYAALQEAPAFRAELMEARKEIAENGLSFKRKAAIQAEMYLGDIDKMMYDLDTTPSMRLEIFKTLVKCGDLEPSKKAEGPGVAATFNLQINI